MPDTVKPQAHLSKNKQKSPMPLRAAATARKSRPADTIRTVLLPLVLVLASAVWLQISAIGLPFLADDYLFLDHARHRSLITAMSESDPIGNYWRPVGRQLYFWVIAQLGESSRMAHAVNMALFAAALSLFWVLVRRVAGSRASLFATAIVALHYAADVPLRWASGSQDLIAITGAVGSLCLLSTKRPVLSAISLVIGLLAKETVALTPLIAAAIVNRRERPFSETMKRVWPLLATVALWAFTWLIVMHDKAGNGLKLVFGAIPASFVHLGQVVVGAEWSATMALNPSDVLSSIGPLLVTITAVALWSKRVEAQSGTEHLGSHPMPLLVGASWICAGTAPVISVVNIWSAYYYLFALFGVALILGCLLARWRLIPAMACFCLVICGSAVARARESFSTGESVWNSESHANKFYFDRSMRWVTGSLGELLRLHPSLPAGSVLLFSGFPAYSGWQIADGSLVRWAYRDSSLRSYYAGQLSLDQVRQRPVLVFVMRNDSLTELPPGGERFRQLAASQVLAGHFDVARDALLLGEAEHPDDPTYRYWSAWVVWALGDSGRARDELGRIGFGITRERSVRTMQLRADLEAGSDTHALEAAEDAVIEHALDPEAHALLFDVLFAQDPRASNVAIEVLAMRLLAPTNPAAWRRWGEAQFATGFYEEAYASLGQYRALGGEAALADEEVDMILRRIRASKASGPEAQRALRRRPLGSE